MFLATIDSSTWAMTGIGFGCVFCILVLLVFVLNVYGSIGAKSNNKPAAPAPKPAQAPTPVAAQQTSVANDTEAAIATALYLFYKDVHDTESYKLTIKHADHPAWHSQLNQHLAN